ncbi:helix-turn-helix transcriptional regulator [Paraburkholderia dioscoreae]|uniref:helix-turn-helix transcriptional regulator n=1 Tax=Paraburkholderia dioscoreae TaxID=2604047 RepID=UPI0038990CE4
MTNLLRSTTRELALRTVEDDIVSRVSRVLQTFTDEILDLDSVAAQLGVPPRTLRRKLAEKGNCFRAVQDSVLAQRALMYLRESNLPVLEIAARLRFTDVSNFRRAFRRWTGTIPAENRSRGEVRMAQL